MLDAQIDTDCPIGHTPVDPNFTAIAKGGAYRGETAVRSSGVHSSGRMVPSTCKAHGEHSPSVIAWQRHLHGQTTVDSSFSDVPDVRLF